MFKINDDSSIYITRGDIASIEVTAQTNEGETYMFQPGDILRLQVFKCTDCASVVLKKIVEITEETEVVIVTLSGEDTKIGDVINKPKNYFYEIELNPDTLPQTIIGYDDAGGKIFRLFPEGSEYK